MSSMDDSQESQTDAIFSGGLWMMPGSEASVTIRLNLPPQASQLNADGWTWTDEASLASPQGLVMPAGSLLVQFQLQAPVEGQRLSEFFSQSQRSIVVTDPPVDSFDVLSPTGEPICRPATDENNDVSGEVIRAQGVADSPKVDLLFPSEVVIEMLETTGAPSGSVLYFTYGDFLQWWRDHAPQKKRLTKKRDPGIAADFPLVTNQEVDTHIRFFADAPSKSNVTFNEAGGFLSHQRKKSQYGLIVRSSIADPESALDELNEKLECLGKDAIMSFCYCLCRLVEEVHRSTYVDVGFNELAHLQGRKRKMGQSEGDEFAQRMESQLKTFESLELWAIKGHRTWTDQNRKTITVRQDGPLIKFYAPFYKHDQPPLTGQWKRPAGWTLLATPWVEMFHNNFTLSPYIGRLKSISQIPTGKISGDWAQSMALYIAIHGRRNAKTGAREVSIRRRDLLTQFRPKPENDPDEIFKGTNPSRARRAFCDAMKILKEGVGDESPIISDYKDPDDSQARGRQGWGKDWLDDLIEITLSDAFGAGMEQIQQKSMEEKEKKAKKPAKSSKKV
jgi:hypothetical protein